MLNNDEKQMIWDVAVRIRLAAGSIPWRSETLAGKLEIEPLFLEILNDVKNGYLSLFHEREQADEQA